MPCDSEDKVDLNWDSSVESKDWKDPETFQMGNRYH